MPSSFCEPSPRRPMYIPERTRICSMSSRWRMLSSVYSTLETGLSVILLSASSSGRVILLLSSISTLFLHIAHCDKGNEKFGGSQKNNVFYGLLTSLYSGFRTYFIPFTKHLLRLCCSVLKYSHCACTLPFSSSSGLLSAYSKPSC
jgi:hypothetical protein